MPRSSIHPEQPFILTLPQFGSAMAWLADRDISPFCIASLFGVDRNIDRHYVSVLIHRAKLRSRRKSAPPQIEALPFHSAINWPLTHEERRPTRIRREALKPDEIRSQMEEIVTRNSQGYTFLQGVAELNALRPYLGDPRNKALLRLLAKLGCHRAWFFTHAGWSRSSIDAASQAYLSAVELHRRTRAYDELQIIADAALIASNSHLNRFEPTEARHALGLAAAARESQSEYLNEEYYRQLAVAYLQEANDNDEDARSTFKKALAAMKEQGRGED